MLLDEVDVALLDESDESDESDEAPLQEGREEDVLRVEPGVEPGVELGVELRVEPGVELRGVSEPSAAACPRTHRS